MQYAAQVTWAKNALAPYPLLHDLLPWLGVDITAPSCPSTLERLLRMKALLLVAVALKFRSLQWLSKLPAEVKEAAACGAACPLFWPPRPDYPLPADLPPPSRATEGASDFPPEHPVGVNESGAVGAVRTVVFSAANKMRTIAHQALEAVDWPSPRPGSAQGSGPGVAPISDPMSPPPPRPASPSPLALGTPVSPPAAQQMMGLRFALQDWLEQWFAEWGLEVGLLFLLIAAFTAVNAISLVCMVLVAVGMAVPVRTRQHLWRWVAVPFLAAAVIWQYSELVGPPPEGLIGRKCTHCGVAPDSKADLLAWLGLTNVSYGSVWAFFVAYAAAVLQLHYDAWRRCNAQASALGGAGPSTPLLHGSQSSGAAARHSAASLWAPLRYEAQSIWQWHDWVRYAVYRWYIDFLLIAVVALCTLDNDIIHAGYLALALFFFRSRLTLRAQRNALFHWLPVYNFAVMVTVLAYQAPFEDVWDWPLDEGRVRKSRCRGCRLPVHISVFRVLLLLSCPPPPPPPLPTLFLFAVLYIGASSGPVQASPNCRWR